MWDTRLKNNKENAGESFRKKVLSGIIYSLLITLIAEFFLVRNLLTAADYVHEAEPDNSAAAALSDTAVESAAGLADWLLLPQLANVKAATKATANIIFFIIVKFKSVYAAKITQNPID